MTTAVPAHRFLSRDSRGIYDPQPWIEEGDGQLASARTLRAAWMLKKRALRGRTLGRIAAQDWSRLVGHPNASFLLLGYSVEMYLKSGLVKMLRGCPEATFETEVRRYSHQYTRLAEAMEIPPCFAPPDDLKFLETAVLSDARYPPFPGRSINDAVRSVNERTSRMWGATRFRQMCQTSVALREYVQRMDMDEQNPSSFHFDLIEPGGYMALRVGGNLPSRVTFKSPRDADWGKPEIERYLTAHHVFEVRLYWPQCDIFKDTGKRLVKA